MEKLNRGLIVLFFLFMLGFSFVLTNTTAHALDQQREALLGKTWSGTEAGGAWTFKWERQGKTNVFSGTWRGPGGAVLTGTVTINVNTANRTVTVNRPPVGGVSCTYGGSISPGRANGSYSCSNGYTGPWNASIY